jgi:acyl-CoA synthetase (AMP-forming)/AMP-acid ligase II
VTPLLSWLDNPSTERGISFATPDGWDRWSYERLAGLVRSCAQALIRAGVPAGGRVTIIEENGPRFAGFFFGSMLAGATPSPVAPRPTFGDRERYDGHLARILEITKPDLVVRDGDLELGGRAVIDRPQPELALIQFTSGTSGNVKPVRLPYAALEANIRAIAAWLEMKPQDATASWLPVHHDMGLVGCLLAPIVTGSDLWLMSPSDFVRRPLRYLRCFGEQGANLTALPGFGLDHIVRRVPPSALDGMDFSRWRAAIVGAERVSAGTLERFTELCAPHGFSGEALLPAYGLAEATLAVTGLPLRTGWQSVPRDGTTIVGCGPPLTGATVSIVDGEIVVGGDSVPGGEVRTGDAGFLDNGQLYVIGRMGDSVKIRGRALFAEDVDAAITAACAETHGRMATLLGTVGERTRVVVLLERPSPAAAEAARSSAKLLAEESDIETIALPSGAIARTSSGKPRRRELWRAYLAGELSPLTIPERTPSASGTR